MGFAQIEPRGVDDDASGVETLRVLLIDDDRDDQLLVKDLVEDGSDDDGGSGEGMRYVHL